MLKALSIRQPWAFLILLGENRPAGKDVENRTWATNVRGPVYLHAARAIDPSGYETGERMGIHVPDPEMLPRGGLVGLVEIVDCVQESPSPWFTGPWGFVLRNPQAIRFRNLPGKLGFFTVPEKGG